VITIRGGDPQSPSKLRSDTFSGTVWADTLLAIDGLTIATVVFTPGSRTFWHTHERGQILHIVTGLGLICTRGQQPQPLRAGDLVWIAPGEEHWHGAVAESLMAHTAVSLGSTHWGQETFQAEYRAAENLVRGAP
jgi:quercetin dioxygenase-like cupin family protein